ncbi:hypothetical protein [uncultured Peptoniphilus sp.]|uniref:hypothetical protein n=1 Tax=uncultured Peptoniphilus sp. TaxID=254354 RepID=UPI0025929276|nr:hypothetical protein [uncultured Peptoniphilus sp.]
MKKKKKTKTPTYTVTYDEIQNYIKHGYEKGKQDSIERATQLSMAVPIMVLRDEFGFGKKRIEKFVDAYMELYNAIDEGYLNLDDIIKTVNEETNVEIVKR